jgi:hypothetical protein
MFTLKQQEHVFDFFTLVFLILTGLSAFGVEHTHGKVVQRLHFYMNIYICLFLILRFNPLVKIQFSTLDRKIAFSAGFLILVSTLVNRFVYNL